MAGRKVLTFAVAVSVLQSGLGLLYLNWARTHDAGLMPVAAMAAVAASGPAYWAAVAWLKQGRRGGRALAFVGPLLGVPLIATLFYAAVPIVLAIATVAVVRMEAAGAPVEPPAATPSDMSYRATVAALAVVQLVAGMAAVANAAGSDPLPLTLLDYIRGGRVEDSPFLLLASVIAAATVVLGAVIGVFASVRSGLTVHRRGTLALWGGVLGLPLAFYLTLIPLALAAVGVLGIARSGRTAAHG